jgi:hypothetical protein
MRFRPFLFLSSGTDTKAGCPPAPAHSGFGALEVKGKGAFTERICCVRLTHWFWRNYEANIFGGYLLRVDGWLQQTIGHATKLKYRKSEHATRYQRFDKGREEGN